MADIRVSSLLMHGCQRWCCDLLQGGEQAGMLTAKTLTRCACLHCDVMWYADCHCTDMGVERQERGQVPDSAAVLCCCVV